MTVCRYYIPLSVDRSQTSFETGIFTMISLYKEMKAKRDGVTSEKSKEEAESALTDICLITTSNTL